MKLSGGEGCGVVQLMCFPLVQEYTEEFRDIAPKSKKMTNIPDGNITLINQRSVCDDLPVRIDQHIYYMYESDKKACILWIKLKFLRRLYAEFQVTLHVNIVMPDLKPSSDQ